MTRSLLLASTREELEAYVAPRRRAGEPVVLVPTMGALHAGHASLLGVAREHAGPGVLAASIFVNPLQFAQGEDLDRYPRTLDADLELCAAAGVDVVFAPAVDEMYPGGEPQVTIEPGPLAATLEGESRPGHFRGVLTVVAKLFGLVRPSAAVFGEKDYQQLVLVRRMSRDLCLGVDVMGAETVREDDGLALSSRNRFLDPEQRRAAAALSRALRAAQDHASYGVEEARTAALAVLEQEPGIDLDYLALLGDDLAELDGRATRGRVLAAARVGTTRLIDNLPLRIGAG